MTAGRRARMRTRWVLRRPCCVHACTPHVTPPACLLRSVGWQQGAALPGLSVQPSHLRNCCTMANRRTNAHPPPRRLPWAERGTGPSPRAWLRGGGARLRAAGLRSSWTSGGRAAGHARARQGAAAWRAHSVCRHRQPVDQRAAAGGTGGAGEVQRLVRWAALEWNAAAVRTPTAACSSGVCTAPWSPAL